MTEHEPLAGKTIMVVEDEFLLADYVQSGLRDAGAKILGPFSQRRQAEEALALHEAIDGAVLDVNLAGDFIYPLADVLSATAVPFVLTTGYDETSIPPRFAGVPCLTKPIEMPQLVTILASSC